MAAVVNIKNIWDFLTTLTISRRNQISSNPVGAGRQWQKELDALVEITRILTGPAAFEQKCELMLGVLAQAANAETSSFMTPDKDDSGLRTTVSCWI